MAKTVTKETKISLAKSCPFWDHWTFRQVIRVEMKGAWYKVGDVIKVKWFGTYGCFDHKDRWVDYWDIGPEIPKPKNWKD